MRMNPLVYRRMKAIASVHGVSLTRELERVSREHYERLEEPERSRVDGLIEGWQEQERVEEEGSSRATFSEAPTEPEQPS